MIYCNTFISIKSLINESLKHIIALFVLINLASCDPPKNINLVNKTNDIIQFKLKIDRTTTYYKLKDLAHGDSIIVSVAPKNTERLNFGIGDWPDSSVNRLVESLRSFEIKTKDITTIYHSKSSIERILKHNRKGIFLKTI